VETLVSFQNMNLGTYVPRGQVNPPLGAFGVATREGRVATRVTVGQPSAVGGLLPATARHSYSYSRRNP